MNANTRTTAAAVLVALGLAAAGNGLCAEEPMKQPTTSNTPNPAGNIADVFQPVDLRKVKLGGELGRRIDLTANRNLLKIDIEKDFLAPFRGGKYTGLNDGSGPFVGIGKCLEGMVRLAAYSGNPALLARKNHVLETLFNLQENDGYIGMMPPDKRTWTLWDVHEQGFIITALVTEYRMFENPNALAAARKLGDYLIERWRGKPSDWEQKLPKIKEHFAEIGVNYSLGVCT